MVSRLPSRKSPTLGPEVPEELQRAFGVRGTWTSLAGGEGRTFRAGRLVFRHETDGDTAETALIARVYERLAISGRRGIRVPRPVRTNTGAWVSPSGWTAWTFVAGRAAQPTELPRVIPAVRAYHAALATRTRPLALARRNTPYDRADLAAWGNIPARVEPTLAPFVDMLASVRRPIRLGSQLIHGDLNPDNILVTRQRPPALIDMAPYWRPADFALAVMAYWMGPYRGDPLVLRHFEHIRAFDQLLVRAALRSVLIWHEFGRLGRSLRGARREFGQAVPIVVGRVERQRA